MVKEACGRGEGEAVRRIGIGADAEHRDRGFVRQRDLPPQAAVEDLQLRLRCEPCPPAEARGEIIPGAILPCGNLVRAAGPGSGRLSCDQVACAVRHRFIGGVRRALTFFADRQVDERIEEKQGLIVGDVFLRLRRQNEGHCKVRAIVAHVAPLGEGAKCKGLYREVDAVRGRAALKGRDRNAQCPDCACPFSVICECRTRTNGIVSCAILPYRF